MSLFVSPVVLLSTLPLYKGEMPAVCQCVMIQSVSQSCGFSSFPSLSHPPLPTLSLSLYLSPCVCACSSRCARRCCGSCRGSSCAATACRRGAGGRRPSCGRGPCPWRSGGRGPPPRASATASCVPARGCRSRCRTDWRRRPPWWQGAAATSASAPSAGASKG